MPNAGKRGSGPVPLAAACTAVYLVVAGAAGWLTLDDTPPVPVAAPPATTSPLPVVTTTPAAPPSTTVVTTTPLPAGFTLIDAPGGLRTVVPEGWRRTPGTVATTVVVTDPANPAHEIRLGGAPVTDPSRDLLARITAAAVDREREPGHQRLTLTATRIRDFPAVRWEFEDVGGGIAKRVAVDYWETAGTEYVVYAAGPPEEWQATRSRLATMTDLSRP